MLGVSSASAGAFSMFRMGLPALGPALTADFDLSLAAVGLVFSAVAAGVTITLVPWGVLTDRIGERPVMTSGLAAAAAVLAVAAFLRSYGSLLICFLLAGMFGASAIGASGRAIMGWFGRDERGFALGVRQMALPLGGAIASLLLPQLTDLGGLQAALLTLAGVMVCLAVAAAIWMRDPPLGEQRVRHVPSVGPLRDVRTWRLGLASFLLIASQAFLLSFLVIFAHQDRDVGAGLAAGLLATVQLGGAGARLVVGRRSDRVGHRIPLLRSIALADAVLLAATALAISAPGLILFPMLVVTGIVAMCWNGLAFTAAAEMAGRDRAGTAISVQNSMVALGSMLTPVAFGGIVHLTSWALAYALSAVPPLAAFVLLASLAEDERRRVGGR